jgi:hypothetical protein
MGGLRADQKCSALKMPPGRSLDFAPLDRFVTGVKGRTPTMALPLKFPNASKFVNLLLFFFLRIW